MTIHNRGDSLFSDCFSDHAAGYASSRPGYPPLLGRWLGEQVSSHALAWDVGTGSGQGAKLLSPFFDRVVATDASKQQLEHAVPVSNVTYYQANEEKSGLAKGSVSLVSSFQAAHWFDLERFYQEVNRIVLPGALCALIGYGRVQVSRRVDAEVESLYSTVLGGWWPDRRKLVEQHYQPIPFPFREIPFSGFALEREWTASQFIAYLGTWSSLLKYRKAREEDPLDLFEVCLRPLWGEGVRRVSWPLFGRVGYCKEQTR